MFHVLVSDKFSEKGLEIFQKADDVEVDYTPGLSPEKLLDVIGKYDALVVRSTTKATESVIEKGLKLKVIGRAGVGVDNIDLAAATRRGICIMNTPGGNNRTTAEHTMAMLLALSRNIPAADASIKAGKWEKSKFIGTEVMNKTLGVIGLGNIGKVVASLGKGLNMKVIGHDPFVSDEVAGKLGVKKVPLDELYSLSDYITVHVPRSDKTAGLIGEAAFAKMKKGVRVLNCARGGIVDEKALLAALESGKVGGAALDVFATEPPGDHPLLKFPNVIGTPHLGASTVEAQDNVAVMVAEQILEYLRTGAIVNSVNVPSLNPEEREQLEPYMNLARMLGSLLGQLAVEAPKEIQIHYGGVVADASTAPIKSAALAGFMNHIAEVEVNPINALALANDRGIDVSETTRKATMGFGNLIGVKAVFPDGQELELQGAKLGRADLRLVRYNGLVTDIELSGNLLIIKNHDRPGVVGDVGTLLGKAEINIANLRLARRDQGGEAVLMVAVDTRADKAVLDELTELKNIIEVRQVHL